MMTNPRDAFTDQSRSPNMVAFDRLGMVFYYYLLLCKIVYNTKKFKKKNISS